MLEQDLCVNSTYLALSLIRLLLVSRGPEEVNRSSPSTMRCLSRICVNSTFPPPETCPTAVEGHAGYTTRLPPENMSSSSTASIVVGHADQEPYVVCPERSTTRLYSSKSWEWGNRPSAVPFVKNSKQPVISPLTNAKQLVIPLTN